jgi:drug/metabolite transporter (DMT)-like permease
MVIEKIVVNTRAIPAKDLIALIIVMFLWAICFPLISIGLSYAPPLRFAALRSIVAGAALLLPGALLSRASPSDRRAWLALIGVGLTSTGMGFAGMFLAGGLVSPGLATVIANSQPLIAAILAYFVLGEQLGPIRIQGLSLGFLGILLIALPGFGKLSAASIPIGTFYILLSAFGVAVGNVWLKRLAGKVDPVMGMGWQFLFGSFPLFLSSALFENTKILAWVPSFGIVLLVLALLGTALPFLLWLLILEKAELTRLNTFTFLTPVFALAIGALFFSESISLVVAFGMSLILVGVWLSSRRSSLSSNHT